MGISAALAASHAASFLASANQDTTDPRNTRVDLIQWAQTVSTLAQSSPHLQQALLEAEDALHSQKATAQAIQAAHAVGYPSIAGIPDGPANLIYAVGRLAAHTALNSGGVAQQMKRASFSSAALPSADELANRLHGVTSTLEPDFLSTLLSQTADQLRHGDDTFATRMAQAGQDVGALVTGNEMPSFLLNLVKTHAASTGTESLSAMTLVAQPGDPSWKQPPPWDNPLLAWTSPSRIKPAIWKQGDGPDGTDGDGGDDGGSSGGGGGGGAIICVVATAAAGAVVPLIVCVVVLVVVVVLTVIQKATHP